MRTRGFAGQVVTSGVVARSEQLVVPLTVHGGTCYAVGVLDASDHSGDGLQLGLKSADGELLALDARTNAPPLLFHCAREDERLHAVVSSGQNRHEARFVLLVGRESEAVAP
jgi:hypothetical protein